MRIVIDQLIISLILMIMFDVINWGEGIVRISFIYDQLFLFLSIQLYTISIILVNPYM